MTLPAITDNERRLLQTIRHAEGTAGANGYSTTFGYQSFDPSKGHPRRIVRSGGYASDAAGAYQFLSTTWDRAAKGAGVNPAVMSQENQDRAALWLVRQRGVDPTQAITPQAIAKLAPEWASLPTLKGNSYYGQPVKSYGSLAKVYGTAAPNPGNTAAPPAAVASAAPQPAGGGSGGGSLPAPAAGGLGALSGGIDLSALTAVLNDGGSSGGPRRSAPAPLQAGTSAASAVLAQQGEILSRPLASVRRPSAMRMAGSPGRQFMQQLLALTQRPGSLLA